MLLGLALAASTRAGGYGDHGRSHGGRSGHPTPHVNQVHTTNSLVQHSGHNVYYKSHGTKLGHGYYYKGKDHHHWKYRTWFPRYHCYCYWDAGLNCWYYWSAPKLCYYPLSYAEVAPPTVEDEED
jgi:hypothetical protein